MDLPNPSSPPSNGSWKIRTPKNPHSFPLAVLVKTNWEDWVNSKLPVAFCSFPVSQIGEQFAQTRVAVSEASPNARCSARRLVSDVLQCLAKQGIGLAKRFLCFFWRTSSTLQVPKDKEPCVQHRDRTSSTENGECIAIDSVCLTNWLASFEEIFPQRSADTRERCRVLSRPSSSIRRRSQIWRACAKLSNRDCPLLKWPAWQ